METFIVNLYTCECGYKTMCSSTASKHKKKACGYDNMKLSPVEMVLKSDHLEALAKSNGTTIAGNHNNTDMSTHITNINLVLPEHTTKEDFVLYLETLNGIGYRTDEQIMQMPGKLLMTLRSPATVPGALIERNDKIVEKLPDGKERIMPKTKAVKVYTHEAIDALCRRPPDPSVDTFFEKERGAVRQKMTVSTAANLRVKDPHKYHNTCPADAKAIIHRMENTTEQYLDKITTTNKDNGFL